MEQTNTCHFVILSMDGWMDQTGNDSLTLVGDDGMFLSTTVCWFDVRLLGQTYRRTDDQQKATRGEGPRPPP